MKYKFLIPPSAARYHSLRDEQGHSATMLPPAAAAQNIVVGGAAALKYRRPALDAACCSVDKMLRTKANQIVRNKIYQNKRNCSTQTESKINKSKKAQIK